MLYAGPTETGMTTRFEGELYDDMKKENPSSTLGECVGSCGGS